VPKQTRQDQILATLAEMLEESPHRRITTASLAQRLAVSEAALYRHFPSKARMFDGLLEFTEKAIFTRVKTILDEGLTVDATCYAILTLLLSFCERNPGICRILAGDALVGESELLRTRAIKVLDRLETQIKQVLREAGLRENRRTVMPIAETSELLLAMAEGKIQQFVRSNFNRLPTSHWQQQWQQIVPTLFH
jgi:TetR/AcrR family transcriptional regulator